MGSGNRFKYGDLKGVGFGIYVYDWPFELTFELHLAFWYISYGFGKAYDE